MPVVWEKPPASAVDHDTDAEIVVVGRVRRRFFRAGGRTDSRTEVVADVVIPARQAKKARAAVAAACARLTEAGGATAPPGNGNGHGRGNSGNVAR